MSGFTFVFGVGIGLAIGSIFTTAAYWFLFDSFKAKMQEVVTMYELMKGDVT